MSQRTDKAQESPRGSEYVVVARRYRPQTFTDLVGQGTVSQALCNAIATERVGHAYLFTGARGVGKTSTARILAKALNCEHGPTATPCGECDICQRIATGEDVDVLEIDGASNRGIDEIRQLRSNVGIRPSRARFKVYIIDEVHMLTKEAFNALLKTLEEPPEHVKFVFCTTEPGKIPITVLSRCQRFDFAPVKTAEIAERLRYIVEKEGAQATPEALELLARRAAGSMRDSQSLLEQLLAFVTEPITVNHIHSLLGTARDERLHEILQTLLTRDAAELLRRLDATLLEGVDAGQMAEQLIGCLRDMMVAVVGGSGDLFLFSGPSQAEMLRQMGNAWGLETLLAAVQILDQAVTRMRHSTHPRILLELALVRISELENLASLSQFIGQMMQAEGRWPATPLPASAATPMPALAPPSASSADAAEIKKKSVEPPVIERGAPAQRVDGAHGVPGPTASPSTASSGSLRDEMMQRAATANSRTAVSAEARPTPNRTSVSDSDRRPTPTAAPAASPSKPHVISHRDESEAVFADEYDGGFEPDLELPPAVRARATTAPVATPVPRRMPVSSESGPHSAQGEGVQARVTDLSVTRRPEEAAPVARPMEAPTAPPNQSSVDAEEEARGEPAADDVQPAESAELMDDSSSEPTMPSGLQSLPDWSPMELKQNWRRALDEINDMTADHAGLADSVAISGPNRLVVRFRQVYNASKSYCERPEKREALEQAFEQVTGCRVRFEFELLKEEPKRVETQPRPAIARTQLRQQVAKHPWVQRAVELFEAEIVNADRDDRPKG